MYYLPPSLVSLTLLANDIANKYEKGGQSQAKANGVYEIIWSFCISKREILHLSEIGFWILFVVLSFFCSMVHLKRISYLKNVMECQYTIWHKYLPIKINRTLW